MELERFFEAARAESPAPSQDLMARILTDAGTQDQAATLRAPGGVLLGFFEAIGGWAGAGGMATASVLGLWLGTGPTVVVDALDSMLVTSGSSLELWVVGLGGLGGI